MTFNTGTRLAALDLGSNSFRLEIGLYDKGTIYKQEYYKEAVYQGSGLDANQVLSQEAMQRGWDCLARFSERLVGFSHNQVRAVATQTLREATNRDIFLKRAYHILKFPIDVISGYEEARLIYQGVAHNLSQSNEQRLVIDIGGRSTEFILGQNFDANLMQSYHLGSSSWSQLYFSDGQLSKENFYKARIAAMALLDETMGLFNRSQWQIAYGSSGTVGAVAGIINREGFDQETIKHLSTQIVDIGDGIITRAGLMGLYNTLLTCKTIDKINFEGLKDDRRLVIAGGVVILWAIFDLLNIEYMVAAQGALRHGALYDLVDRSELNKDIRLASVKRLALNYQIDTVQANRVSLAADHLFAQVSNYLSKQSLAIEPLIKKLKWAAQLHEIGSLISHSNYHKHGAYILAHADAPGFAMHELHRLSVLVLGHRGKLKKIMPDLECESFLIQLLCLRIAVIVCHARNNHLINELQHIVLTVQTYGLNNELNIKKLQFTLSYPIQWGSELPQTVYLLEQEKALWEKTHALLYLNTV